MRRSTNDIPSDMRLWHSVRQVGKWRFVAGSSAVLYVIFALSIGVVFLSASSPIRHGRATSADISLIALALLAVPALSFLGWCRQEEVYRKYSDRFTDGAREIKKA